MLLKICFQLFLMQMWFVKIFALDINFSFAGDFHGIYNEYPVKPGVKAGGVPRMRSALNDNSLFIYVGNILQAHAAMDKIKVAQQILNVLSPDAVILGRNEFMIKPEELEWFMAETDNIITGVNMDHKMQFLPQNKILRAGGVAMIIFGYASEDVEMYPAAKSYRVRNIVQALNEKASLVQFASKEVKLVLAAGCTGVEAAKRMAEASENIHVIFSGCSPNLMWHATNNTPEHIHRYGDYPLVLKNKQGKNVILAHTYGTNKFIGKLRLSLDNDGNIVSHTGEMVYLDAGFPMDSATATIVAQETNPPEIMTGVLGEARVYLDGFCRKSECNLGNMVADAFIQYKSNLFGEDFWTDTPIALVAAGNIRGSVNATAHKGQIMAEELSKALPNIHSLVTVDIKGSHLLEVLEHAVDIKSKYGEDKFLQVSGIRILYDSRRWAGSKILSIKIRCASCIVPRYDQLVPKEIYKLVTTENLVTGDFGHEFLVKAKSVFRENMTNWQAVLNYLAQNKMIGTPNTDRISQLRMQNFARTLIVNRAGLVGMFILHRSIISYVQLRF